MTYHLLGGRSTVIGAILLTGLICAGSAFAASPAKVGVLECKVAGETKGVLKKNLSLDCLFSGSGEPRRYEGRMSRVGVSLGSIAGKDIAWIVLTVGDPANVKLDGQYVGASAGAAAGAGGGANYLTGGFNKKISLQPYALESKQGIGLEVKVQNLELTEAVRTN